jgi:hypothetical protein
MSREHDLEQRDIAEALDVLRNFALAIGESQRVEAVASGEMQDGGHFELTAMFMFDIDRQDTADVEVWVRGESRDSAQLVVDLLAGETLTRSLGSPSQRMAASLGVELDSLRPTIEAALAAPRVLTLQRARWRESRWVPESIARARPQAEALVFLTNELRKAPGTPWADLRDHLTEQGVDPATAWVAELYPIESRKEQGVIASADRRFFAFGLLAGAPYVSDEVARLVAEPAELLKDAVFGWSELRLEKVTRAYPEVDAQSSEPTLVGGEE